METQCYTDTMLALLYRGLGIYDVKGSVPVLI